MKTKKALRKKSINMVFFLFRGNNCFKVMFCLQILVLCPEPGQKITNTILTNNIIRCIVLFRR